MHLSVVFAVASLAVLSAVQAAPCEQNEAPCWSILATKLTNEVRERHGVQGSLREGTHSMLDNAMKHSEWMIETGNFEHQNLKTATSEFRCGVFCSGENIAMSSPRSGIDPATKCVDMWEKSPGHLRNILSRTHKVVAVGIAFRSDGTYYCTQVFGIPDKGISGGGGCSPIGGPNTDEKGRKSVSPADQAKMLKCIQKCVPKA